MRMALQMDRTPSSVAILSLPPISPTKDSNSALWSAFSLLAMPMWPLTHWISMSCVLDLNAGDRLCWISVLGTVWIGASKSNTSAIMFPSYSMAEAGWAASPRLRRSTCPLRSFGSSDHRRCRATPPLQPLLLPSPIHDHNDKKFSRMSAWSNLKNQSSSQQTYGTTT